MRLWIVARVDLSSQKGGAAHVLQFVRHVCATGSEVRLFVPRPRTDLPAIPCDVSLIPGPRGSFWLSNLAFELVTSILMLRLFPKERPRHVYIRHDLFMLLPSIVARILGRRPVIEQNGVISDEMRVHGRPPLERRLQDVAERAAYRQARAIVAVTDGIKAHLVNDLGVDPAKVHVVPNGADPEAMRPWDAGPAKTRLGIDPSEVVIGYLGNFEPYQDLDTFIEALGMLADEGLRFRALLVGGGTRFDLIRAAAADRGLMERCTFAGSVPHSEVAEYIAAMDVCVAPKKPLASGYSPIKLYEYLACGRPVAASNLPGFEILERNGMGVLFEPEDAAGMAAAIRRLMEDPGLRMEMGRRGRAYAEGPGSWTETVRRVMKVLDVQAA